MSLSPLRRHTPRALPPEAAREHLRDQALFASPTGNVCAHLDHHVIDLTHPGRRVDWTRLRPHLGDAVSAQAGGQLRVHGRYGGAPTAVESLRQRTRELARRLRADGLGLVAFGEDPPAAARRARRVGRGHLRAPVRDGRGRGRDGAADVDGNPTARPGDMTRQESTW